MCSVLGNVVLIRAVAAGPAAAGPMWRRIYKKWSSWWNGSVITDICGLKLKEISHQQMRFMGSSTSKIRLRPGLRPGPRWGSLQRSPRPPSWWGGGSLPPPQELHPRSRPFGPRASALRASSLTPEPKNQTSPMEGGKSAGPIKIRLLRPWFALQLQKRHVIL